jgi:hypothetical protein
MSYLEAINIVIEELALPAGQGWAALDELIEKAKEIDNDSTQRLND